MTASLEQLGCRWVSGLENLFEKYLHSLKCLRVQISLKDAAELQLGLQRLLVCPRPISSTEIALSNLV